MLFDSSFVSLPVNVRGRDFCIGDLHGCREMLDRLLTAVAFDPASDRLFSVGDLVHRGPDSAACLRLAEEPWFLPVMGNHEAMQIAAYAGACWVEDSRFETGLEYLADASPQDIAREHERFQRILDSLPLAIETQLLDGRRVGIVHASLGPPYRWADVQAIYRRDSELDHPRIALQALMLWDRLPAASAFAAALPDLKSCAAAAHCLVSEVAGVDLLVSGHCQVPGSQPYRYGRRLFMDTGAGFEDGWLSMVELSTGRCWQVPDPEECPAMPVRMLDRFLEDPVTLPSPPEREIAALAEELERGLLR